MVPNAIRKCPPTGWVVPNDPGVPRTLAPIKYNAFAPRLGLAYSPDHSDGLLGALFGGPGKTSIRAGFGIYFTSVEDLSQFLEVGDPPYGIFWVSSAPPVFESPFLSRSNGLPEPASGGNPFPFVRLGIPVAIHTSDPEAFFTPVDKHNERYEELIENPTWSFFGPQFSSKSTLLAERNHIIESHPRTTFIALHVANWPENLDDVSAWLDKYPNMYVEFGARQAELGRQPGRSRKLFEDYQDRIMFGTDADPDEAMYASYFRWLETNDEYFPYWGYPSEGRWEIYGMGLPDAIIEKVYHSNAEKLLSQFKGAHGHAN